VRSGLQFWKNTGVNGLNGGISLPTAPSINASCPLAVLWKASESDRTFCIEVRKSSKSVAVQKPVFRRPFAWASSARDAVRNLSATPDWFRYAQYCT